VPTPGAEVLVTSQGGCSIPGRCPKRK